ncbi:fibronectin type 3 and ankyrin repeat domains protein 1-like [Dendronephthya gigantea]|uniref:fibronectin type 3 and ankyrin repeat domains protein 1-like n=1 Tax=Dendronephthya gigantea TaxID=151771 RepID=UPI00106ACB46|nr:fibronectin type 3 and ankyrin repeat domains protein 1-like [Dendronephthya gigantea]
MAEIPRPDPPVVGKVTHNSIELYWDVNETDEEKPTNGKIRYCMQEEEIRMKDTGFGNVYSGYARNHVFEGLEPQTQYRYRLRRSNALGDSPWSVIITVNTTRKPKTSEDLIKAVNHKDLAKVDAILQELNQMAVDSPDKYGLSPLMIAAQQGSLEIVEKLLSYGADGRFQNSSGKDSLMLACFAGQLQVAKMLVQHGATLENQDHSGSTALHWAVDGGNIEVVRWLINKGCQVDVKDYTTGWTPLMRLAMLRGNIHIARLLIHHGANISSMDKDGKSVLMMAALNGDLDLVKLLIYKGADFTLRSVHGKTALDFARAFDREQVLEYLDELWQDYKEKERRKQANNWQNDEKYAETVNLLKTARSMASAVDVTE